MAVALHWFTSDLRLDDNPALALAPPELPVVGVFVFTPDARRRHAGAAGRVDFLTACLAALDRELALRGSRLVVCEGDPATVLPAVVARLGAVVVTHATNVEPAARRREARVATALAHDGIAVRRADAAGVHPAGTVTKHDGTPYLVYSAFARAWEAMTMPALARSPERWVPADALAAFGRCSTSPAAVSGLPGAGSVAAAARLEVFVRESLATYGTRRDLPAVDGTSRLSPHLRFGTISAATCVRRARVEEGAAAWVRQLAWRDFHAHVLRAHPRLARESMRPLGITWRESAGELERWQQGTTGIPLVDAGMRELAATGVMHNRVRMVTASFLTRHLLIDWRAGERHFMRLLLDGVVSQNNGNWQWVAGTGTDAQPFHRIFSPVRQGERFDAEGLYVKRWVPELAQVPARHVHQPWTLSPIERRSLCLDYPPPMIDLAAGRARALEAYAARYVGGRI